MNVIPADDIRVELSWDGPSADLDLHVLESEDALMWNKPDDPCWCNESPAWGESGSNDDPRLDIDDRGGYGPENITIGTPVDGNYPVKVLKVHYFAEQADEQDRAEAPFIRHGLTKSDRRPTLP